MQDHLVTVQRHLVESQSLRQEATGAFTALFWNLILAFKIISREVNKAGLANILGLAGTKNVHGEEVKTLDVYAHETLVSIMQRSGQLCGMASEESEGIVQIPAGLQVGKYTLAFDPLDGSSNIDANASIGTIFSIHQRVSESGPAVDADFLQPGREQVAAGYVAYGSSTLLVYSTGDGVFAFTLDQSIGEFLLSHSNIVTPTQGKIYSANEGNTRTWDEGTQRYINYLKEIDSATGRPYSTRYIGSLISDFHRNLIYGGIYLYPASYADPAKPQPKLRLLYEAAPLSFIAEQAGGRASTGSVPILDIQPTAVHECVPLIVGSKADVERYEAFFQGKEA